MHVWTRNLGDERLEKIFEGAHTNHHYNEIEKKILQTYESFDYHPPNSEVYRHWKKHQSHRKDWDRWMVMGMIGFFTGIIGFTLGNLITLITESKWDLVTEYLKEGLEEKRGEHMVMTECFLICWGISLAYVLVASGMVVFLRPSAVSSGMPELIAFLNGTIVRDIFSIKTLFVKFFSCALAVGGGMPCGPEGPMIHMGSLVGAGISQFESKTFGVKLPFFSRFRNSEDRRNFISAGAAAGIASAFCAPVGGLLFAFEEVSSYWSVKLSWQTFFCCMVSSFTTALMNSCFEGFKYHDNIGSFRRESSTIFYVEHYKKVNVVALIPSFCLGLVGGGFGAIFTFFNIQLSRFRRNVHATLKKNFPIQAVVKLSEPLVIMTLVVVFTVYCPRPFECTKSKDIIKHTCFIEPERSQLCLSAPKNDNKSEHLSDEILAMEYTLNKYDCENEAHCIRGVDGHKCPKEEHHKKPGPHERMVELNGDTGYRADKTSSDLNSDLLRSGAEFEKGLIYKWSGQYHEMATLVQGSGHHTVVHLFSRNTSRQFSSAPLAIYCVFYFFFACWTAGTQISAGLVVPMLLIGALYGRILGIALVEILGEDHLHDGFWEWIDPGVLAMLGAVSFFAGVTRLTMSLAVIMLEMTNDIQLLILFMVTIITAKLIGDYIAHPLYHALMELKCIPYLDAEAHVEDGGHELDLEIYQAAHCMTSPVVVMTNVIDASEAATILNSKMHGGFPVVRSLSQSGTGQFIGMISRTELSVILASFVDDAKVANLPKNPTEVYMYQPLIGFSEISSLLNRRIRNQKVYNQKIELVQNEYSGYKIDLSNYVNTSSLSVMTRFSLARTYILFRSMGLRHLVVVDEANFVRGMLTRKDLMGFAIEEMLHDVRQKAKDHKDDHGH